MEVGGNTMGWWDGLARCTGLQRFRYFSQCHYLTTDSEQTDATFSPRRFNTKPIPLRFQEAKVKSGGQGSISSRINSTTCMLVPSVLRHPSSPWPLKMASAAISRLNLLAIVVPSLQFTLPLRRYRDMQGGDGECRGWTKSCASALSSQ